MLRLYQKESCLGQFSNGKGWAAPRTKFLPLGYQLPKLCANALLKWSEFLLEIPSIGCSSRTIELQVQEPSPWDNNDTLTILNQISIRRWVKSGTIRWVNIKSEFQNSTASDVICFNHRRLRKHCAMKPNHSSNPNPNPNPNANRNPDRNPNPNPLTVNLTLTRTGPRTLSLTLTLTVTETRSLP